MTGPMNAYANRRRSKANKKQQRDRSMITEGETTSRLATKYSLKLSFDIFFVILFAFVIMPPSILIGCLNGVSF